MVPRFYRVGPHSPLVTAESGAYVRSVEGERHETYERIPWETLQAPRPDRQWILYLVAGAIVVGALAYSFMSNRPPTPVAATEPTEATPANSTQTAPAGAAPPAVVGQAPTVTEPIVITEADLYAVDPERLREEAIAHAEWFAAEYLTLDGSEAASESLAALLPAGIPPPVGDGETLVFVEWSRAVASEEVAPLLYSVDVLVRWLMSGADGVYVRQAPTIVTVEVEVGDTGPRVTMPPVIGPVPRGEPASPGLVEVPENVASAAVEASGATEVIGGVVSADGSWRVVVMAPGPDGVVRPQTVVVP